MEIKEIRPQPEREAGSGKEMLKGKQELQTKEQVQVDSEILKGRRGNMSWRQRNRLM